MSESASARSVTAPLTLCHRRTLVVGRNVLLVLLAGARVFVVGHLGGSGAREGGAGCEGERGVLGGATGASKGAVYLGVLSDTQPLPNVDESGTASGPWRPSPGTAPLGTNGRGASRLPHTPRPHGHCKELRGAGPRWRPASTGSAALGLRKGKGKVTGKAS